MMKTSFRLSPKSSASFLRDYQICRRTETSSATKTRRGGDGLQNSLLVRHRRRLLWLRERVGQVRRGLQGGSCRKLHPGGTKEGNNINVQGLQPLTQGANCWSVGCHHPGC